MPSRSLGRSFKFLQSQSSLLHPKGPCPGVGTWSPLVVERGTTLPDRCTDTSICDLRKLARLREPPGNFWKGRGLWRKHCRCCSLPGRGSAACCCVNFSQPTHLLYLRSHPCLMGLLGGSAERSCRELGASSGQARSTQGSCEYYSQPRRFLNS